MKYLQNHYSLLASLLLLLPFCFFESCVKETLDFSKVSNKVDWEPKLGAPLAYGNFSLKDLIGTVDSAGVIKEYSDSLLYFGYTAQVFSKLAGEVITLPNQTFTETFSSSNPDFTSPVGGVIDFTRTPSYTFSFNNGAQLDTINLKAGNLVFEVNSSFNNTGWVLITLPTLIKDGNPFQEKIVITDATGTFSNSSTNDISGYSLTTTGSVPNQVPVTYEIYLQASSLPASSQNIAVNVSFTNLMFKSLFGYVGQYTLFDTTGVFKFNFFNNFSNTNVAFADPRFHLNFLNSFGLPVQSQIVSAYTQSIKSNSSVTLAFDTLKNPFNVNYPSHSNLGQTASDSLFIDSTDCPNLPKSLSIYPQYLFYEASAATNVHGFAYNSVLDTSQFKLNLAIELPLNLKAGKYEKLDTLDFDLGASLPDSGVISQVIINCAFQNGIPVNLQTQIILCDSNMVAVDSLFTIAEQPIIKSATLGSNGKVTLPQPYYYYPIDFTDPARIQNLKKVRHAIMQTALSTINNGQTFVKMYSYYRLSVKFGVEVDLKINSLNQLP